jgi:hypothetical protein
MQRCRGRRLTVAILLSALALSPVAQPAPSGVPAAYAAEDSIDPKEIALRLDDLPPGFALTADGARQDRALGGRGSQVVVELVREDTVENRATGPLTVRQVVVRFDNPVQTRELLPQFRDALMAEGFTQAPGHEPMPDMACLMKADGDAVTYEVVQAKDDTLTFTIVKGQPGPVQLQSALDLSAITAARYDARAAALGRAPAPAPDLTLRRSRVYGLHERQMFADDGHELSEDEKEAALDQLIPKPKVRPDGLPTRSQVAVVGPPPALRGEAPGKVTRFEDVTTLVSHSVAAIDTFWSNLLGRYRIRYQSPRTAWLAKGDVGNSACGEVDGPAYCPAERTIYLNESFFAELWPRHDFAATVVIAHEWAHYVQHRVGILGLDIPVDHVELQADCFSGLFANHALREGWLERGDIPEVLALTRIVGDEDHGAGEERTEWFMRGFSYGNVEMCFPWV